MNSPQVPAARHTLDILRLLSTIDVPISAARIHRELGIPRSTTYHLLSEMVEAGFVVHLSGERTYGLGLAAYSMANAYTTQQPLVRLSQKYLDKAASLAGGSGHLSRLSATEIVYLQETRAARAVSLISQVGSACQRWARLLGELCSRTCRKRNTVRFTRHRMRQKVGERFKNILPTSANADLMWKCKK